MVAEQLDALDGDDRMMAEIAKLLKVRRRRGRKGWGWGGARSEVLLLEGGMNVAISRPNIHSPPRRPAPLLQDRAESIESAKRAMEEQEALLQKFMSQPAATARSARK